jgi:hypothetical protein
MTAVLNKMEIQINISSEFKACHGIFKQKVYENGGIPAVFKLHQVLKQRKSEQNSFAYSLADSIHLIANFLNKNKTFRDIQEDYSSFILLQNLLVNRLDTILDIVKMPNEIREKEFKIFQQINAWAYFLKPHTAFISKYPTVYVFENNIFSHDFEAYSLIVNNDFVIKYNNAQLNRSNFLTELTKKGYNLERINEKPILLILPNITEITNQLCDAINKFIDLFLSDKKYIDLYFETQ